MNHGPATTDRIFAALGNTTRRALLGMIVTRGELPVQELADHFAISRPSVSEHLKVLKDAGLVSERKSGRQRFYQVEVEPLLSARAWFDTYEQFWKLKMSGLRQLLDGTSSNE